LGLAASGEAKGVVQESDIHVSRSTPRSETKLFQVKQTRRSGLRSPRRPGLTTALATDAWHVRRHRGGVARDTHTEASKLALSSRPPVLPKFTSTAGACAGVCAALSWGPRTSLARRAGEGSCARAPTLTNNFCLSSLRHYCAPSVFSLAMSRLSVRFRFSCTTCTVSNTR
jgi:hypothetical protein